MLVGIVLFLQSHSILFGRITSQWQAPEPNAKSANETSLTAGKNSKWGHRFKVVTSIVTIPRKS